MFRVLADGTIEAGSAGEAADLQKLLWARAADPTSPYRRKRGRPAKREPAPFTAYWYTLTPNARRLLAVLADRQAWVTTRQLAEAMGVTTMTLPPVVRAIRETAAECGIGDKSFIERREFTENGRLASTYRLAADFVPHVLAELAVIREEKA